MCRTRWTTSSKDSSKRPWEPLSSWSSGPPVCAYDPVFIRRPMPIHRFGLVASLSALAVVCSVRPALAAQDGPMYWVCEFNTRTQRTSTLYVSDVTGPYGPRMNTGYTSDYLEREFAQFLRTTYQAGGATHCTGFDSISK